MKWLFKQLDGPVQVDTRDRDDVIVVEVPQDTVGYITGARRAALSGRLQGIQILKNNLRFPFVTGYNNCLRLPAFAGTKK